VNPLLAKASNEGIRRLPLLYYVLYCSM
jgi:hypothetical protein